MNIIGHVVRRKLLDRFADGEPLHHAFLFLVPKVSEKDWSHGSSRRRCLVVPAKTRLPIRTFC